MPLPFRFRWIPFVAAVAVAVAGVALGNWQTRRAEQKEAIEHRLAERGAAVPLALGGAPVAADAAEYRRVVVRGTWMRDWPVFLDNRPRNGVAGFHVLMPLKIAGSGMHVLVARGWAPRDLRDRAKLPDLKTPEGEVEVSGIAVRHPPALLQLGEAAPVTPRAIVQNLDAEGFARASGLALQPFVVEQTNDAGDGLARDWPRPSLGIEKHRGYAFQWYGLAATAIAFFVVTGFRRERRSNPAAADQ